jgi:hypothetical protein
MSDLRLDDVVELHEMIGPNGRYGKAICKTCSQVHKSYMIDKGLLASVDACYRDAQMKAWNCCHEGEEPLDGFLVE